MKVIWRNTETTLRAEIQPFNEKGGTIDVSRDFDFRSGGLEKESKINWPAIGSQEIKIARQFADALTIACDIARTMMEPVKLHDIKYKAHTGESTYSLAILGNNKEQVKETIQNALRDDAKIISIKSREEKKEDN